MGTFNIDTLFKNSISKNFGNLILSADMKLYGPKCPTRETATTPTCIGHVITTPQLIHSNVFVEKCGNSDQYCILLATAVTTKVIRSKRIFRVINNMENPEITCKTPLWSKHLLGKNDFNTLDLKNGWEMFAQFLLDVMNKFFPLKTREIFSTRRRSSWITRKIPNELKKPQKFYTNYLISKNMDLLER